MEDKLQGVKTGDLEKMIAERLDYIEKIVGFVKKITRTLGIVVESYSGDCYAHVIRELKPVFYFYYQVNIKEDGKVLAFDQDKVWQDALREMINRQDEIIAEIQKQRADLSAQ